KVAGSAGIVIACPAYVHALPGAFKNAVDWLVSRQEIIGKPIALLHASHRGEDVLADLHRVLSTVSDRFAPDIFARINLRGKSVQALMQELSDPDHRDILRGFLATFVTFAATERQ
ncbi:MAG TPA: NAD(P)H-dependent oxidoreductase, partial [Tabrizicola sp.]|nr:NAD(P)H-dependent oxidoreductase [Tabrizicola sp.]